MATLLPHMPPPSCTAPPCHYWHPLLRLRTVVRCKTPRQGTAGSRASSSCAAPAMQAAPGMSTASVHLLSCSQRGRAFLSASLSAASTVSRQHSQVTATCTHCLPQHSEQRFQQQQALATATASNLLSLFGWCMCACDALINWDQLAQIEFRVSQRMDFAAAVGEALQAVHTATCCTARARTGAPDHATLRCLAPLLWQC